MKKKSLIPIILIAVLLCFTEANIAEEENSEERVLIGFKGETGRQAAERHRAWIRKSGGNVRHSYRFIPGVAAKLSKKQISRLKEDPRIAYIEMDSKVHALDAELDNSWGVKHIGAGNVHPYNKGTGVKVAIIDTGIDYGHPDLSANYHGGYDFVNNDDEPMDDHGHGTHCAGIVAALDNSIGVVGVAPEAHLYAIKVLDFAGSGYVSDVVAGIDWAIDNNIDIISMSFGSNSSSQSLQNACDNAYNNGLILVAAAGNDYRKFGVWLELDTVDYPAKYNSVIAVGATDNSNNKAIWSSAGPALELAAPGLNIYSTYWNNSYITMSGTSMACPHVSGVAALILANKPSLSNAQVRAKLQQTADDLGTAGLDQWYGYGLVDADGAVPGPANNIPVAHDDTVTTQEDTAVTINVLANDTDADSEPLTVTNLAQPPNGSAILNADQTVTYTPNLNFNGSDSFTYTANDGKANSNIATVYITITNINDPPTANPQTVETTQNTSVAITLSGNDVEGNPLTYFITVYPSHGILFGIAPDLTYTPYTGYTGSDNFKFTVSDGLLTSEPATVSINVKSINHPPAANNQSVITDEDNSVNITLTGSDLDDNPITFSIFSPPSNGTLELDLNFNNNGRLTYVPNLNFNGSDSFKFKVNDGKTDSEPATISITVNAINDPPKITSTPLSSATENSLYAYNIEATDPDAGDNLTYSLITYPFGMTINPDTGVVEWIPTQAQIGNNDVVVKVTDSSATSDTQSFTIVVNPVLPTDEFSFSGSISMRQENRHTVTIASPGAKSMTVKLKWNNMADLALKIYSPSGALAKVADQNTLRNNIEQTTIYDLAPGNWQIAAYVKLGLYAIPYTLEGAIEY